MQCCNAFRQHAATVTRHERTTPYLWISDEQLNEAFSRFLKVSKVGRRFGSNVPGPLEARRRQSKRRMGFLSTEASQGAGLAEFGALFGAGPYRTGVFHWQPPTKDKNALPAPPPNLGLCGPASQGASIGHSNRNLSKAQATVIDRDTKTWQHFDGAFFPDHHLQEMARHGNTTAASELPLVLDEEASQQHATADERLIPPVSLQSAKGGKEAEDISENLRQLESQNLDHNAFRTLRGMILEKHKSKAISATSFNAMIQSLLNLVKNIDSQDAKSLYHETIVALSRHLKDYHSALDCPDGEVRQAWQALFGAVAPRNSTYTALYSALEALQVLAAQLNALSVDDGYVAEAIVNVMTLASDIASLHDTMHESLRQLIVEVLNTSNERNLGARVTQRLLTSPEVTDMTFSKRRDLVMYWLTSLHQSRRLASPATRESIEDWTTYTIVGAWFRPSHLRFLLHRLESKQLATALMFGWSMPNSYKYYATNAELPSRDQDELYNRLALPAQEALFQELHFSKISLFQHPLITLLLTAQQHGWRCEQLIEHIFAVYLWGNTYGSRPEDLYKLIHSNNLPIPTDARIAMINHLLQKHRSRNALHCFLECPQIALSMVPDLPKILLADGHDPAYVLQTVADKLNERYRGRKKWQFSQNMTDLISALPTIIANTNIYTAKFAFSRVWKCYRFLRERGVKVDASMSKAMVTTGVVRALKERSSLPDKRLDYIVEQVRWLEGDVVADRLRKYTIEERRKRTLTPIPTHYSKPDLGVQEVKRSTWQLLPNF